MRSSRVAIMGLFASLLALIGCDKLGMSQVVYTTGADVPQILQAASAEGPCAELELPTLETCDPVEVSGRYDS